MRLCYVCADLSIQKPRFYFHHMIDETVGDGEAKSGFPVQRAHL